MVNEKGSVVSMKNKTSLIAVCLVFFASTQCLADDGLRWNGYMNVVGGILKDEPRNDTTSEKQYPGYGLYTDELSFDAYTSGAVQVTKMLDEKMSATSQIYAEAGNNNYEARMKWLYLTYNMNDTSTFRIGRIGTPFYSFSDYINLGMSYHWVTPPVEFYQFDTSLVGVDYIYRNTLGEDGEWSAEIFSGSFDDPIPALNGRGIAKNVIGLVLTGSTGGWLTLRTILGHANASLEIDGLTADGAVDAGLAQAEAQFGLTDELANSIRTEALPSVTQKLDLEFIGKYYGFMARTDLENWLLIAEWSRTDTSSYLLNYYDERYVTGAYTLDDLVLHLTYAEVKTNLSEDARIDSASQLAGFTPTAIADYLSRQIGAGAAAAAGQNRRSLSAGVRINLSRNTALKFDITRFEEEASLPTETAGIGDNLLFSSAFNVSF